MPTTQEEYWQSVPPTLQKSDLPQPGSLLLSQSTLPLSASFSSNPQQDTHMQTEQRQAARFLWHHRTITIGEDLQYHLVQSLPCHQITLSAFGQAV